MKKKNYCNWVIFTAFYYIEIKVINIKLINYLRFLYVCYLFATLIAKIMFTSINLICANKLSQFEQEIALLHCLFLSLLSINNNNKIIN